MCIPRIIRNMYTGDRPYRNYKKCINYLSKRQVANIIIQLIDTLSYFYTKYGFVHRDLHQLNVMFDEEGRIKIIDFGLSCLSVKGHLYSVTNNECASYDLFTYITSLLEYQKSTFSKEAEHALLTTMQTETHESLYTILENEVRGRKLAVFHKCYWDTLPPEIRAMAGNQMLLNKPDEFGELRAFLVAQTGGRRRRLTRRRRR